MNLMQIPKVLFARPYQPRTAEEIKQNHLDALALLQSAKLLLDDPKNWCRRQLALGHGGFVVHPNDPTAACWCASGALQAWAPPTKVQALAFAYLNKAVFSASIHSVVSYNDRKKTTHSALLKKFDKAIQHLARVIDSGKPITPGIMPS